MNVSVGLLKDMINSSVAVLRKPSIATFEQYEKRGTVQQAAVYAVLGALVASLFRSGGGFVGVIGTALSLLVSFAIFVGVVYYFGKRQGGTGTLDEVAYTFALFVVPLGILWPVALAVLLAVPILGWCLLPFAFIAVIGAYIFYGFLAVQSSMNLFNPTKSLMVLSVAALAMVVGNILISSF